MEFMSLQIVSGQISPDKTQIDAQERNKNKSILVFIRYLKMENGQQLLLGKVNVNILDVFLQKKRHYLLEINT